MTRYPGVREDGEFRRRGRTTRFRGRVVGVSIDEIVLPGGHEAEHEVIHLPPAVAVLPIHARANGRRGVVLVEQFRNSVDGHIHEIPAGVIEPGEAPADCAARELAEETGYRAANLTPIAELFAIPGTSAQRVHFFIAEELSPGPQELEPGECLRVKEFELASLLESILHPSADAEPIVVDAKTHLALLHFAALDRERTAAGGEP